MKDYKLLRQKLSIMQKEVATAIGVDSSFISSTEAFKFRNGNLFKRKEKEWQDFLVSKANEQIEVHEKEIAKLRLIIDEIVS